MYELFYGFREKPFSILPDPAFLFLSQKHRLALSMLEYGLANQTSFTVVTGEIGSGKTTLVRKLLQEIDEDVTVGLVSNTQCSSFEELFRWILFAFELEYRGKDKVELYHTFTDFLIKEYGFNRRVVLIIDEAQNLGPEALEQLRMLSNVNAYKHHVLQLVLVGQPNLRNLLQRPELEQFAQRVGVDYHLKALNSQETVSYIRHRLKVAGGNISLFTEDACLLIWRYSKGIPRLINILCDTALVYGFAEQESKIEVAIIEEVARDKQMVLSLREEKQKYEKEPILYGSDDSLDNMDLLPSDSTITQENNHHKENQNSFIKQSEHDQDKATTIERLQLKLRS